MYNINEILYNNQRPWTREQAFPDLTYLQAVNRLHAYIINNHWTGKAIEGPDPIGKYHWRFTRFVRSYLPWLPGDDSYLYLQGQAYWIKSNLAFYELTGESRYLEYVKLCTDYIVECQPQNGAWLHPPIRGRKGFISTVEGVWVSLGLIAAYKKTDNQAYLDAALKWYNYQINYIGFQNYEGGLAANYYAHSNSVVPNVTTMLIWLAAELHQVTGDGKFLKYTDRMMQFIANSQLDSGELPYALPTRVHFMCYQYNAFQFLDLASYYRIANDERIFRILEKLAAFLATGVSEQGHSCYSCSKKVPVVHYWTAALAVALREAHELGLASYISISERAFRYLLAQQNYDGGFAFSTQNYGVLSDRRSYPRYLAMILYHLLYRADLEIRETLPKAQNHKPVAIGLPNQRDG